MKISPNYTSETFTNLNLTEHSSDEDWKTAVEIFNDRYSSRFINPIKALMSNDDSRIWEYSGFAIMTINCLLIETLNQFYYGVRETKDLKKDKNVPHINSIEDAFVDFLGKRNFFKIPAKEAKLFYLQVRNGLVHQAETKKSSKIHIQSSQPEIIKIVSSGNVNEGVSIRRDLFTTALLNEYDEYKKKLLDKPIDKPLRKNFIQKMGFICDDQN